MHQRARHVPEIVEAQRRQSRAAQRAPEDVTQQLVRVDRAPLAERTKEL